MRAHHHLNITSRSAHKTFWVDTLGGSIVRVGRLTADVISFQNLLIFLTEQSPTGGTKGTTVNHVGFAVPDIRAMVGKVRAAGYPIVTRAELPPQFDVQDDLAFIAPLETSVAFAMGPDEMKVEFLEYKTTGPTRLHHVHFFGPRQEEMRDWYVDVLGAQSSTRGRFISADYPDVNLTYSQSATPVVGTRGRTLDRLGFEIEDLESFCNDLLARGINLDRGYTQRHDIGVGSVLLTDPWGTHIELTEPLVIWNETPTTKDTKDTKEIKD